MVKVIRGKVKGGGMIDVVVPDIHVHSYVKDRKLTYLDLFYSFAQVVARNTKKTEEDKIEAIVRTMIELHTKIVSYIFISRLLYGQEKKILSLKETRRIRDHKPYQIYIGLLTAQGDALHSLRDMVNAIDGLFHKEHGRRIKREEWFRMNMDIRNFLHHVGVPNVTKQNGGIVISFETKRLEQLNPKHLQYFKKEDFESQRHIEFIISSENDVQQLLVPLDRWAKAYIDQIDPNEEVSVITGYRKNGSARYKKIKLRELLDQTYQT